MIRHLGSSLTDITYVFDEPTIGLHPHDSKPETISIGDHIVDLGPGAGRSGGEVCFEGAVDQLRATGSLNLLLEPLRGLRGAWST